MERNIDLIVANPAGNTTIMVLSPVAIEDYCRVSDELLRIDFGEYCSWADTLYGEQVAFITDNDGTPHMNMSGLEFCGNASRAFAYYCAAGNSSRADSASDSNCSDSAGNSSRADSAGDSCSPADSDTAAGSKADCGTASAADPVTIRVSVSGHDTPLEAYVDPANEYARIRIPAPVDVQYIDSHPVIDFGGISHMVVSGIEATEQSFEALKAKAYRAFSDMMAFGVMFLDPAAGSTASAPDGSMSSAPDCTGSTASAPDSAGTACDASSGSCYMTPVVYVRDTDTTYFEGSCASGSAAAACAKALSEASDSGTFAYEFRQPAGTLSTCVVKENGKITSVELGGHVEISEVITIGIDA